MTATCHTDTVTENSAVAKRRGRPKANNPLIFRTIGMTVHQWEWLQLWFPGSDNPTTQMQELLDRAMKFWPAGPAKFR